MQGLGQRRPTRWLLAVGVCAALAAGRGSARAAPPRGPGDEPALRLRIVWGGGTPQRWQGTLTLSEGSLGEPTPLGLEPDEPGSLWIEADRVRIASPSPRKFDGLDVSVWADLGARLTIDLAAESGTRAPIEINLAQLLRDTQTHALDAVGNRLSARRAPGDALRVEPPPSGLVLSPGQRLPLGVKPRWLAIEPGAKVRIDYELRPARGTKAAWTAAREIDWPAADAPQPEFVEEIPAPLAPGAYDVAITASTRSLKQKFGLRQNLAERQVQFVVAESVAAPAAETDAAAPELVAELDPTASRWWEQIARLPGTQRWWRGPVGSGHAAVVAHVLGRVVELRARTDAAAAGQPAWEAYPLSIVRPGACHILEIEYPGDKPQQLGVCLMENAASGPLPPMVVDQGLNSQAPDRASPQWRRHRVAFWPRSRSPVVLLVNRSAANSAWIGKLRVYELSGALAASAPEARATRQWLAHCDRPLLADALGASQRIDALTGQSIDDWQTFYEAAERLASYLRLAGYSGLALTVAGEGSALYPSPLLEPTPRYDTGIFSSYGHDPLRKDVLELLLRVFDRHGLRLMPVVRFTTPLPALEAAARAAGDGGEGLSWRSVHGESLLERRPPRDGAAARYNPLDPRVQRALTEVVDELAARCRHHPSFAGVGVRVEPESSVRLQGVEWGLDRQTLARFAAETGSGGGSPDPRAVLAGERETWLAWRAAQMSGLVAAWGRRVDAARPGATLHLLGVGLYSLPELQGSLRPQLPWVASSGDALRESGLDVDALRQQPNVVVAVSRRSTAIDELDSPRLRLESDRARDLFETVGRSGAALEWREGQAWSLSSIDLRGPLKSPPVTCLAQASAGAPSNRERFVEDLAAADALTYIDGGAALALVVDSELLPLVRAYQQLPAVPFSDVPGPAQPVVVRRATVGSQTYLYLVNTAPWPTSCRLRFDGPAATRAVVLGDRELPAPAIAPGAAWEPPLEGYDLIVLRIDAPQVKVQVERVEFDAGHLASLDRQIRDLMSRAAGLHGARRYDALANASFEQLPTQAESVPGWKLLTASPAATARVEGPPAHEGSYALRLTNPDGVAAIVSAPIPAPATGRLTLGVWVRVSRLEANSQFRLAVRGIDSDYYRAAPLPADAAAPAETWRWCALRLDDLVQPGAPLEIRFELRGAGDVSLDDVRTFDLDFTPSEKLGLAQILHLAEAQLRVEKIAECRETLSGYWPQFLEAHVAAPLAGADEWSSGPLPRQAARPAAPPAEPGVLDSLKRLVPRPLRWY